MAEDIINFDLPQGRNSIIKVLGVGGGGSNAVNYMYRLGIKDVDFVVCNTDSQALTNSPVQVKIQIGSSLTEGRGAGNKPDIGKEAAQENIEEITEVLSSNTKMIFITAGMGGGTGTGAAPVIAKAAKELGILTVAIVTIPFRFEGQQRVNQAVDGINELKEHVDSLLVINNEKLREIYGNLKLSEAFAKADTILATAAKGIAEIITVHGYINVDFADVQTVMTDSGVAIMGSAIGEGENRAINAIQEALNSPLLNNNDITGAKNILLNITSGDDEISMDEIGEITDYVNAAVDKNALIIWGTGADEQLGQKVSATIIATGFESNSIPELYARKKKTDKVPLEDYSKPPKNTKINQDFEVRDKNDDDTESPASTQRTIEFDIMNEQASGRYNKKQSNETAVNPLNLKKSTETLREKRTVNHRFKPLTSHNNLMDEKESIEKLENEPAYMRKKIKIDKVKYSSNSKISRYSLEDDEKNGSSVLRDDNPYLHDNVD